MQSELLEECLPQGPLGSLRPYPTKFKIFTFFHIILNCKTPENHVKSSFHDYCYRHFFLRGCGKCFGLTSNIRKITPKCAFSITFQKFFSTKIRGEVPVSPNAVLARLWRTSALSSRTWPLRFAACFNKTSGETSMLVACFSSIFLFC